MKRYALDRISSWHPDVNTVIGLWDVATVQPLTLRSRVPAAAWQPTNVSVIGDAVHAMSPALGVGANTSLRDAQILGAHCSPRRAATNPCCPLSATTTTSCAPTSTTPYAHPRS
ncbi:FAD-dependent oxidoreductase [Streptomyces sp. MMG1121]|uniref:FAD-dependent oxidoreductase n=1 Tax=Streptomyces sp. MMG1121 TaxID=1415544 RepID=UPI00099D8478|nr:FAD-dependent monooxygenase [Streptomyces sp. MMG1121]